MLDIQYIREHAEEVKQNCVDRGIRVDIDKLLELDATRRDGLHTIEELRAARKQGSKSKPTPEQIAEMKIVGEKIKLLEEKQSDIEDKYHKILLQIPNNTHPDSPIGGEDDFTVLEKTDAPIFNFEPKDHEEILIQKGYLDFERGAKVVGSKFFYTKNNLVRLNRALISYGIDVASKHGYELIETPDLAKNDILESAGFNPRGEETQIYGVANTDLSLIGTAEITVLGYHSDEIIDLSKGPKKYAAISHCYRTEAGAYGRTRKGLYRVHQFSKLELFIFCKPEDSNKLHEELLVIEKEIVNGLGLSYQVIDIATGDLGGPAYRKFDIEAWMTMKNDEKNQGGFGEITSTSNCTDYQARSANIRYRTDEGKTDYVHTLNGTAIVSSRMPIAIVEQFQDVDGNVHIPEVLQTYMGDIKTL